GLLGRVLRPRPRCVFFQAEDGIRDRNVTGVQTCALPIFVYHLDPIRGDYAIDAVNVGDIPLSTARSGFALVDDEPHTFAGTVRANMLLARPAASDAHIRAALDAAGLRVWLSRLPDGLDTADVGVSGGDRVRFSIARAILSERRIDRKSTRLNSSHVSISYAVFCLKKKNTK